MFRFWLVFFSVVFWAGPVHAAPLLALVAPVFAATTLGTIVGTVLSVGAAVALSFVAGAFSPKQTRPETPDTPAEPIAPPEQEVQPREVSYGERVPHQGVFGIQKVAGHLVHVNEFDDATKLQLVYVLADGWCDSLDAVEVDGIRKAVSSTTISGTEHIRYTVADYGSAIDIRFHDGRPGQAADTELVAQTPGWDANRKFSGKCYVAITLISDRETFSGIPNFGFFLKGLRVYDIRLDSSSGGSGSHRFNDPTTWEWSANPAVCAYHYLLGFFFNSERVLGAGLSSADIDVDTAVAAMNVSDEAVTDPNDASRRRYEAHLTFQDTVDHGSVLDPLVEAMGGFRCENQGRIAIYAGRAQSSVLTVTEDDVSETDAINFTPRRRGGQLYNAVQGTYTRSDDLEPAPYAAIAPSTFITQDLSKQKTQPLDYPQVQNPHQAYVLARQSLYRHRLQASIELVLDIKDVLLEVGDWFVGDLSNNSMIGSRTYQVTGTSVDFASMRIRVVGEEISTAVFEDDATAEDIAEPTRIRAVAGYQTLLGGLALDPQTIAGPNGESLPGLSISYTPVLDPAVRAIDFELRVVGETDVTKLIDNSPIDGSLIPPEIWRPETRYEVRARLDSMPGRVLEWTDWVEASADTGSILLGFDNMFPWVNELRDWQTGSIRDLLDQVHRIETDTLNQEAELAELVVARFGGAFASVQQTFSTITTEIDAQALAIIQVQAEFEDNFAGALIKFEASAAADGWESRIGLSAYASGPDDFYLAGLYAEAKSDGTTRILLDADQVVVFTGATTAALFQNGTTYIDIARIKDADITTAKIGDAQITAAKIADANITTAKIADGNITNAKIGTAAITSAKIGALEVNTFNIAGDAVTTMTSSFSASGSATNGRVLTGFDDQTYPDLSAYWTTKRSFAVSPVGSEIILRGTFGAVVSGGSGDYAFVVIRLLRDSTELTQNRVFITSTGSVAGVYPLPCSVDYIDIPGAGTYTYSLQATWYSGIGSGASGVTTTNNLLYGLVRKGK